MILKRKHEDNRTVPLNTWLSVTYRILKFILTYFLLTCKVDIDSHCIENTPYDAHVCIKKVQVTN